MFQNFSKAFIYLPNQIIKTTITNRALHYCIEHTVLTNSNRYKPEQVGHVDFQVYSFQPFPFPFLYISPLHSEFRFLGVFCFIV